jgi:hypothetical protein
MQSNLYIPKTIKVGFQEREGTFTGKLGYIVYIDEKGVTRKETSWNGWRDDKIKVLELDNKPRDNYVFNKGVQRCGHRFGSGRSFVRVYDPRDFEFEISVDNLIGILMHSDVSKRDIVEECVFAWAGKDLVLLPVNSEEYKTSVEYTKKQAKKVSARDLKEGFTYVQKKNPEPLTYIGYHEWYKDEGRWSTFQKTEKKGKKHVFYNSVNGEFIIPTMATFAECISEEIHSDFPNIVDKFIESVNSKPITGFSLSSFNVSKIIKSHKTKARYDNEDKNFFKKENDGNLSQITTNSYSYNHDKDNIKKSDVYIKIIDTSDKSKLEELEEKQQDGYQYHYHHRNRAKTEKEIKVENIKNDLFGTYEKISIDNFFKKLTEKGYKSLYQTREDKVKFKV